MSYSSASETVTVKAEIEEGTEEARIVREESDLLDRVRGRLAALAGEEIPESSPRAVPAHGAGLDYNAELIELRDEVAEAKLPEDRASLIEQMHRVQAVAARRGRSRTLPIDPRSPYFAHLRLHEEGRRRDVLIGKRGFIDRAGGVHVVDWRHAPVSQIYYRYEEGDDYDESFGGRSIEGVVEARRNVTIDQGRLRRIGCPQGTFVCDARGRWLRAEGSLAPVLQGGQGTAARAPRRGPPADPARLGVHGGEVPRADKHLPEIAALIDPAQFEAITRPTAGLVLLEGGAGSGKTTVALHRIAYLNFQDPERFRPSRMLLVVPSDALVRYVAEVLPALGVGGVPVVTYRGWARRQRRKLVPDLADRYSDDTPEVVARVKKHPVLMRLLERRIAEEVEAAGQALARDLEGLTGREIALEAWANGAGKPLVRRLGAVRKRCEQFAPACEVAVRRRRDDARDVVSFWADLLTDEPRLQEAFAGGAPGEISSAEIRRVVSWCAAQLSVHAEETYADVDEERRRPVDGRPALGEDDGEEETPQGRLDPEDDALLLWIYQRKHGRLGRRADKKLEYEHLAVDEAQDLAPIDLRLLLSCTTPARSVTIAGDGAQRLVFDNAFQDFPTFLRDAGCEAAEAVRLELSYRSTLQVMELAREILGPLADPAVPLAAREGAPVSLHRFTDLGEAVAFLGDALRSLMGREPTASVALVARHAEHADVWFQALQRAEVPALRRVRRQDFGFTPGIDVTDVAQVKGLEFDYVVVLDAGATTYPATIEARHLLHIAVTRAAHQLWLVATETPTPLAPAWLLAGSEEESPPDEAPDARD